MIDRSPTVRVTLGDEVAKVARRSTYDLSSRLHSPSEVDLVTVTAPAALAYDGAGRSVMLPEGRFISLDVDAGAVVGVAASPHLKALSLSDAIVLARDVGALLEHHGWAPDTRSGAAYTEVETDARADATGYFRADVGRWRAGGDGVTVRLRQTRAAADRPDERRYLLSVEFENPQISEERARALNRLRDRSPAP